MAGKNLMILVFICVFGVGMADKLVPAIITFGDSSVDVGNNDYLATAFRADYAPYGRDFKNKLATGRFSNGKLATDITADTLGFEKPSPPYLSPEATGKNLLDGANFASAGSGFDDKTAMASNVITLTMQVEYFKEYQSKLAAYAGSKKAASIISGALYIVSFGNSDFMQNYYLNPLLQKMYSPDEYSSYLIRIYSNLIQELYGLGARRIGVTSLPPIGCVPAAITLFGYGSNSCVQSLNNVALKFNKKMNLSTTKISKQYPKLKIAIFDIYKPLLDIVHNPSKSGSTPAVSAVIRKREAKGGFIMSASHNPGGPENDWGIKFNYSSGQPAPEYITDKIYENTLSISEIKMANIPDTNLSQLGPVEYGSFTVEVIDPVSDYVELMENIFDFNLIKTLFSRSDFRFIFDAMHAVTGAYAKPIFVDKLGADVGCILNGVPLQDFGQNHPDPNLTYAKDLVDIMFAENAPDVGAASDGDGDRNMILGKHFFVTPSDSVAMIAANAQEAIPYFQNGPKGLARSMPTSGALDRVAEKLNLPFFEVPTGWKYFGNLMDAGKLSICGEESFGTGSDHIREKDGIWAVLAWLSIIAYRNKDKKEGEKLVSVSDVAKEHWESYGRNFFSRYDYEECEFEGANNMLKHLRDSISKSTPGEQYGSHILQFADDFSYTDPVDGCVVTNQGIRFVFTDGSRIIFRLSGTGSAGATVRMYIEQLEPDVSKHDLDAQTALKPLIDLALSISKMKEFTGRETPTVIT